MNLFTYFLLGSLVAWINGFAMALGLILTGAN